MTNQQFASCMAFLSNGIGVPMPKARVAVYFDLLGDIPLQILEAAIRMGLLEHPWHTLPSPAELRQAALNIARGQLSPLSAGEAWRLSWEAAGRIDPTHQGAWWANGKLWDSQTQWACHGLPAIVVQAMQTFGVVQLCYSRPELAMPRFMKIFEALEAREQRLALMPPKVLEAVGMVRQQLAAPVLERIGVEK